MVDEIEFETYLKISPKIIGIYLCDKNNLSILYKKEKILEKKEDIIDYEKIKKFLEKNIFKLEKFSGKFVKNISLIIENKEISHIYISLKKKNYELKINSNNLGNILTEARDLFKENHQDQKIMHMIINKYLVDGKNYFSFINNLKGELICLEVKFICIPNKLTADIEKILQNYHIKINQYMNENYIKSFIDDKDTELSLMAYKIQRGLQHHL